MERKLELADICMYLPYDMTWGYKDGDDYHLAKTQLKITRYGAESPIMGGYLPILRPMSNLTQPMTHPDVNGGEEFVPLKYLLLQSDSCVRWEVEESIYQIVEYRIKQGLIGASYQHPKHETIKGTVFLYLTFSKLQILSRLHFDYNSLIEQGLAIDINTL